MKARNRSTELLTILNKTVVSDFAVGSLKKRLRIFIMMGFAAALMLPFTLRSPAQIVFPTEAPTGFDGLTNGFESQEQFDLDRAVFEQRKYISDGKKMFVTPIWLRYSSAEADSRLAC